MTLINLSESDINTLKEILDGDYQVLLFGSRVKLTNKPFSDIDVCLKSNAKIARDKMALLKIALDDSNLPYIVDLIDYHAIDDSFKKIIDTDGVNILIAQHSR